MIKSKHFNGHSMKHGSRLVSILLALVLMAGTAFAQTGNVRINITKTNISVVDALKEVEKQSGLSIGYNSTQLSQKPAINLNLQDAGLSSSLSTILNNTGYTYEISDKYVKIVPVAAKKVVSANAPTETITGTVVDSEGEPMIGVTVFVKGTSTGAQTDFDGNFHIKAAKGDVITFSYVGFNPQEVTVGDKTNFNISMVENSTVLDEVVVTALGIKREQKSLSYNVQQVKGDLLTENKDANFINSLAGKVAGVNINASSSGVGGISKVVMRGTKSIMQSSNALYVIDGMPMRSGNSTGSTEFVRRVLLSLSPTSTRMTSSRCQC